MPSVALGMPARGRDRKEERAKKDYFYGKEGERETTGVRKRVILCVVNRTEYNQLFMWPTFNIWVSPLHLLETFLPHLS